MKKILIGAHRGAMCHAPENTLAAFEKAMELGTYRIELDVHGTRDGHIIVMHDATVDRTTDGSGSVAEMTLARLQELEAGETERVPLFSEVLAAVRGRCKLLVEIKAEGIAHDVVKVIAAAEMVDECTISSFDEEALRHVQALSPRVATGYFLTDAARFDAEEAVRALGVSMVIVPPGSATTGERVAAAKRCGLHVRCGLRDDLSYEETNTIFRSLADMGVDEIACGRPDWMGRMAEEYDKGAGAIVISDLDKRVSGELIAGEDHNLWSAIPYEAEGFVGVMLGYREGTYPAPVTVKLGVTGPYRIWVGMYSFIQRSRIRVRLSGDRCCREIRPPEELERISLPVLHEVFWKEADLTGQDLILEGAYRSELYPGALAYLRLEPIEQIHVEEPIVRHPLAITEDGYGIFGRLPHTRPDDLLESFETIPDGSCMRMLLWGCGNGDVCNYPTRVGTYQPSAPGACLSYFYNTLYDNRKLWQDRGWDSLELVGEYARSRGWEFQVYLRVEALWAQYPFERIRSQFFLDHPEYHCLDRTGQRVARLSYAHPEVQEHILRLVREISEYNPDGVCLAFVRGVPLVLYEPIMVEGFRAAYGVDPRELDESDVRWWEYQGKVITSFLRQVKGALKLDQHLSAILPGNEVDCRRWGLDVASWVNEGIVDDLFPVGQRFTQEDVHVDSPEDLDFEYFQQLTGRGRTRLMPMLYPWNAFQSEYAGWRQRMFSFLDRGADGYAVWDGTDHLARIGDIGYEARTADPAPPRDETRSVKLLSMDGYRFDRYHHFEVV